MLGENEVKSSDTSFLIFLLEQFIFSPHAPGQMKRVCGECGVCVYIYIYIYIYNSHGWSDGTTDPCTGGKRVFQASDGQMDGRTDRRMDG